MSAIEKKQYNFEDFLKPSFFFEKTFIIFPYLITLLLIFLFSGLYLSLIVAPTDYIQGEQYRILYVHVPVAWLSTIFYYFLASSSLSYIISKNPFSFLSAKVFAQIGFFFTLLTLITGSLWGKPTWGTYWVWDARLTSVLVMLFLYLTYLLLSYFQSKNFYMISSLFSLFGLINIPIIKFSVKWWSTLHQPASITKLSSTLHVSMMYPLLITLISFIVFSLLLYIFLMRNELLSKKIKSYKLNHTN